MTGTLTDAAGPALGGASPRPAGRAPSGRGIALSRALLLAGLAAPAVAVLFFFFLLPLGAVLAQVLLEGVGAFGRAVDQPEFWPGLRNTLMLGLVTGLLSVSVGFGVAYHLARMPEGRRTALLFLIALPLTFSGLIVAFGFILAFGRAGFVTLGLERLFGVSPVAFSAFVFSPAGLALAYCYYLIPRVVMLLLPVLVNFDPAQLLAAESLGARPIRAFLDVLLPQIARTTFAAFCLVVAVALGTYGTALALVGTQVNILPLQVFAQVSDAGSDFARAAALSMVLTALCTAVIAVGEAVASGDHRR